MARDNPNVTILSGKDEVEYAYADAAEAIEVGALVELSGGEVQNHSEAAAQRVQPRFCIEAREWGMVADDPDGEQDNYESGELAKYVTLDGAEKMYVNLADGENVSEDDILVSDGAGALAGIDTGGGDDEAAGVAVALEDVDNSAGGDLAKIRVEVLA